MSRDLEFQNSFLTYDFCNVVSYLKGINNLYSISRIGNAYQFCVGQLKNQDGEIAVGLNAGIGNFMDIFCDGSMRMRVVYVTDATNDIVDISHVIAVCKYFQKVYSIIVGSTFIESFIYAQKYEELHTIKQFKPRLKQLAPEILHSYESKQKRKYGESLIIDSNRIPCSGYIQIDKRYFEEYSIAYTNDELIKELFYPDYGFMGYFELINAEQTN